MSLRSFTSTKPFKTLLRSRSLWIHNTNDPHLDDLSNASPTFIDYKNLSIPVDFNLFAQLRQRESSSIPYFLNKVVSFCAKSGLLDVGIRVHSAIVKMGFTSNVYICSAIVDLYSKCGDISCAQKVFDELRERNVVTWNSLISGYLNVGRSRVAIGLFIKMLREGVALTQFSISGCLVGCSQLEDQELGVQVHGLCLKAGLVDNVFVGTGLIDMYSKCCLVDDAKLVFDGMVDKNVITWTSMVTAYARDEQPLEAMGLVREMTSLGLRSNYVTYNCLLSSLSSPDYMKYCRQVHCCIIRQGLESNSHITATLVTVYSKCSKSLEEFNKLCSVVKRCDQVSWNAIVAGYSNLGYGEEALKCVCEMRRAGIEMDNYTFASVLGVIGIISALEEGMEMHSVIFKTGYSSNVCVQNGLVSMYARCGTINYSKKVFWLMEERDVISWNSLLTGCAHHGFGKETVDLFEQMRKTDIKPDSTTFLTMLSACSHAGFVDKGLEYFDLIRNDISFEPLKVEHYSCIVDILGRAGRLGEAEAFIDSMPIKPELTVYKALLSASLVHGNTEIAARSAKKLLELFPNEPATYVLLSNSLKMECCWNDAAEVWKLMCDRGVKKEPGYSWI